jgi:hypothetical protein
MDIPGGISDATAASAHSAAPAKVASKPGKNEEPGTSFAGSMDDLRMSQKRALGCYAGAGSLKQNGSGRLPQAE